MARKIRLDFSKIEERSGWKTTNMPEGLHEFKVELVDDRDANDGTKMLTYGLRPTDSRYKTRLFPYYCKQQPNQYFKLRDLHIAAGVLDPKKAKGRAVDIDPDAPIGKLVAAEVVDGRGQYSDRSEIDGVYSTDILDDLDTDDTVDDEEEYDEEADEVDEDEYEDEEEEDEEDEEDLETLTLPELRRRAKGLGIDTVGVKKADLIELIIEEEEAEDEDDEDELDEDDLGDDELEDEEFDDEDEDEEEEEPEPAPRRRAAPARKAPAKAAPARRTVKRR